MSIYDPQLGRVTIDSSNQQLFAGFDWAKSQALAYVSDGTPVGKFYEAALPGRDAFCMRDLSHQSVGANVLGLQDYTKNMLFKFAEGIAESRDWCTYWEIDKYDRPAPVDYTDDSDFWYNLPANFDILDCCYKQYLWTGDRDYVDHPIFRNFYERTVTDYIDRWDKDKDGFPEHYAPYGRRGIASYVEDGLQPLLGGDVLAAQYAAFGSYSRLLAISGQAALAEHYENKAKDVRKLYNRDWWNEENGRFNGALMQDRRGYPGFYYSATYLPFYFDLVEPGDRKQRALRDVVHHGGSNVEEKSHMAEIFYRHGLNREAYSSLLEMMDPQLKRREYPEVSYSIIGAILTGTMGLSADAHRQSLVTMSRLTDSIDWIEAKDIPVMNGQIDIAHTNGRESSLTNRTGRTIQWEARFSGFHQKLYVNGTDMLASIGSDGNGEFVSTAVIELNPGDRATVKI
ncbi:hypothetical protein [Paenibacillus sp. FSL R10-2734]|uniref:hypothetical protein n=1 Tax=Paenibacillus sp. FSL R10-2734 TaxID=2954691 RepID=UPI0030DB58B9